MSDARRESEELRQEQAKLDKEIVAALDRRARLARRLGELRSKEPSPGTASRSLFPTPKIRGTGDMPEETVDRVVREIVAACASLEQPARVTYVGPEGGAAHLAARSRFGEGAELTGADGIQSAIDAVSNKAADFAAVPLETKREGLLQATILHLASTDLRIVSVIDIADDASERIRYAIVGTRPSGRSEEDVTAFAFSVHDTPGALLEVLRQVAERGVNLVRIQSHPAAGPGWNYLFFVEVVGHATDRPLVSAFEEVKRQTKFFKVLGSYPAA